MNPRIASGGRSFKGAFQYYMHDPGADTRERIAWTHTVNMLTGDPDKAWKIMAFTAKHQERLKEAAGIKATGRKAQKPVMAYSLSWHPEQSPEPGHMRDTALASIKLLGLEEHEAIIIAHSDTPHRHIHVVVNRVHPLTGKIASDSYTQRKLSDFALEYGEAHGLTYSPKRADNKRKREEDRMTRTENTLIAAAWAASDNGPSFVSALAERGLTLAQGHKRLVVVDQNGTIYNPVRHIEGVQTKHLRERLKGVDLGALPDADALARARTAAPAATEPEATPEAPAALADTFQAAAAAEKPAPTTRLKEEAQPAAPEAQPAQQAEIRAETQAEAAAAAPQGEAPAPALADHAALRIARMVERHQRERAELNARHDERIQREKREMDARERLDELARDIKTLREKCSRASFWRWIIGASRRDRKRLAALEQTHAEACQRYDARLDGLEDQHHRRIELLHTAQQQERETLLRLHIANKRDAGREIERETSQDRDMSQVSRPDAPVTRPEPGPDLSR